MSKGRNVLVHSGLCFRALPALRSGPASPTAALAVGVEAPLCRFGAARVGPAARGEVRPRPRPQSGRLVPRHYSRRAARTDARPPLRDALPKSRGEWPRERGSVRATEGRALLRVRGRAGGAAPLPPLQARLTPARLAAAGPSSPAPDGSDRIDFLHPSVRKGPSWRTGRRRSRDPEVGRQRLGRQWRRRRTIRR